MPELILGILFFAVFVGVPLALILWLLIHAARRATICVGQCRDCDYDLRGSLASGRCPECGRPFRVDGNGNAVS